ncbi:hypothetical protein V8C26DRAFT_384629 [Trichoderma gracile]
MHDYEHACAFVAHRRKAAAGRASKQASKAIAHQVAIGELQQRSKQASIPKAVPSTSATKRTTEKAPRPVILQRFKPWLRASNIRAPVRVPRLGGEGGEGPLRVALEASPSSTPFG